MAKDSKPEVVEGEVVDAPRQVIETFATPDDWNEIREYLKIPVDSIYNIDVTDIIAFTALKLRELEEECKKNCKTKSPSKK